MMPSSFKNRINRIITAVFIAGWAAVLLGTTIYSYAVEDRKTIFSENRNLIQFETPTLTSLRSGNWESYIEDYHKDQFVFREEWIRLYYGFLDLIGERERNAYVRTDSNDIVPVTDWYVTQSALEEASEYGTEQRDAIVKIADTAAAYGGQVIYLNVPNHQDMVAGSYPAGYENKETYLRLQRGSIIGKVRAAGIPVVETWDLFQEHKDEYLYFLTDNHWTPKGAWYAYQKLLSLISGFEGKEMRYPEWDELEHIPDDRRMAGNYVRKWGDAGWVDVDHMEYAFPYDMPAYKRYDNGQKSKRHLYDRTLPDYRAYMDGNIGNTVIETGRSELPSILYVGFSFTNILEAMSVYNFDRVESLDPRFTDLSICGYIAEHQPDYIVVVKNDIYEGNTQYRGRVE